MLNPQCFQTILAEAEPSFYETFGEAARGHKLCQRKSFIEKEVQGEQWQAF